MIPFRFKLTVVLAAFASLTAWQPAFALHAPTSATVADAAVSTESLTDLESRAAEAAPRERCFLYTQLLHGWTELAGRSITAGDDATEVVAMQHAEADAEHLKSAIAHDSKRLKEAEMLMERSVHRLSDMLRVSSLEQHDRLAAVVRRVSSVHDDLLAAVFSH